MTNAHNPAHPNQMAVIILNWNAAADTLACARQVLAWEEVRASLWLVDNASADDEAASLAREFAGEAVRVIASPLNLGFAGGSNLGIQAALEEDPARPILLLNNDARLSGPAARRLLAALHADEATGCVGPLLFDADAPTRLLSAGARNPVRHHHTARRSFDPRQSRQPVEAISGTAILIKPELFAAIGLLDEAYFFSTELADFCTRARAAGYGCLIETRARAFHRLSRSADRRQWLYPYYIVRNRFLYVRKFYGPWTRPALFTAWTAYSLALSLKLAATGHRPTARAVALGLRHGLQNRVGRLAMSNE